MFGVGVCASTMRGLFPEDETEQCSLNIKGALSRSRRISCGPSATEFTEGLLLQNSWTRHNIKVSDWSRPREALAINTPSARLIVRLCHVTIRVSATILVSGRWRERDRRRSRASSPDRAGERSWRRQGVGATRRLGLNVKLTRSVRKCPGELTGRCAISGRTGDKRQHVLSRGMDRYAG